MHGANEKFLQLFGVLHRHRQSDTFVDLPH